MESFHLVIDWLIFGHASYGILVTYQGLNLLPLQWKHGVLTIGPPGKSLHWLFKNRQSECWHAFKITRTLLHCWCECKKLHSSFWKKTAVSPEGKPPHTWDQEFLSEVFIYLCFFFWPCCMAFVILVPWPGIEPWSSAVKMQSPNYWTASREFLPLPGFYPGEKKNTCSKKEKRPVWENS